MEIVSQTMDELFWRPEEIQVAMYKNGLGDDAMKIYQGMQFATDEPERTVQKIIDNLVGYTTDVTKETYDHFLFWPRKQDEDECFNRFLLLLLLLVACRFCQRLAISMISIRIFWWMNKLLLVWRMRNKTYWRFRVSKSSWKSWSSEPRKLSETKKNVSHKECQFSGFHHIPRRDKCLVRFLMRRTPSSSSSQTKNERCTGRKVNHIESEKRISTSLVCTT